MGVFSNERVKKRPENEGEELEREVGCGEAAKGEGAASGPYDAGCDFNTWSSQSHYRPRSEEPGVRPDPNAH